MSKKNRNKLRKQARTNRSNETKKSISEPSSSSLSSSLIDKEKTKSNQIEIIHSRKQTTKAANDKCLTNSETFHLKPSWMMKTNSSFNCNRNNTKFSFLIDLENVFNGNNNLNLTINLNLKLFDYLIPQQNTKPTNLFSISKVYYRFDIIIDLLYFLQQYLLHKNTLPKMSKKRQRPGYIIERDCHIFGGCVEDEAQDEFFISSGAVYQSWPYVYEPGYKMTPLIDYVNWPLSKSADSIYINEFNDEFENESLVEQDDLPAYSLENFEINLIHVDKTKRKRTKKWNSNGSESSYDCSTDECFYEDSDSDDSESIIAYKQRHAIGLNCFNLELKNIQRPTNRFSSVYYDDETSKERKIQFLSQKRFDKSVNDLYLNCCNQDYSSRRDKFVQAQKYSYSSDNLVF